MKGLGWLVLLFFFIVVGTCQGADEDAIPPSVAAPPKTSQWAKVRHAADFLGKLFGVVLAGKPPPTRISIIGAGFSRSGTKSFSEALERLGGHNTYDIRTLFQHDHEPLWLEATRAWKEDGNLEPLELLLQEIEKLGYSATMDTPLSQMAHILMKLRPEAKVIWTYIQGKSFDQWYGSFCFISDMGCYLEHARPWKGIVPDVMTFGDKIMGMATPVHHQFCSPHVQIERASPWHDTLQREIGPLWKNKTLKEEWRSFYENFPVDLKRAAEEEISSNHEEHATGGQTTRRSSRYFEYSVTQGWGPLFDIFNVSQERRQELLQEPFPHVNESATLHTIWKAIMFLAATWPFWVAFALVGVLLVSSRIVRFVVAAFFSKAGAAKEKTQ